MTMMMEKEDKEAGEEGWEGRKPTTANTTTGLAGPTLVGGSPFGEDSHSSRAENVERGLFVFCPWNMLCSKVQEWRNVITDFLWRSRKLWNAYRKKRSPLN